MNLWTKAIIIGVAIEGILFSLMHGIGWGPCGPGSPLGAVVMLLHFPAVLLMMPFNFAAWPKWMEMPALFFFASLFWTLITYAFLVTRDRK